MTMNKFYIHDIAVECDLNKFDTLEEAVNQQQRYELTDKKLKIYNPNEYCIVERNENGDIVNIFDTKGLLLNADTPKEVQNPTAPIEQEPQIEQCELTIEDVRRISMQKILENHPKEIAKCMEQILMCASKGLVTARVSFPHDVRCLDELTSYFILKGYEAKSHVVPECFADIYISWQ